MNKNTIKYKLLVDYCAWGRAKDFHEMLLDSKEPIDIFFDDNILLKIAIYKRPNIFVGMIEYYEDKVINATDNEQLRGQAKHKLSLVLDEIVDQSSTFAPEVLELINKYKIDDNDDYQKSVLEESEDITELTSNQSIDEEDYSLGVPQPLMGNSSHADYLPVH